MHSFLTNKIEVSKEKADDIDMRSSAIIKSGEGLVTNLTNVKDRNIFTEGNEIAEQALQNNIVDFQDKRIRDSNQKISQWKNQVSGEFLQVDLGPVRSLDKSEILVDKVDFQNIPKGVKIVDTETAKNTEYDLVLVGRKLKDDEVDDIALDEISSDQNSGVKHYINKEIFHEVDLSDISLSTK